VLKYRENVPSKSQQRHFDKREMSLGEIKKIISLKFYRTKPHSISSSQTALAYYYHYHLQKIRPRVDRYDDGSRAEIIPFSGDSAKYHKANISRKVEVSVRGGAAANRRASVPYHASENINSLERPTMRYGVSSRA